MSILNRISSKLLVVCVSFSLPIAVMSFQMTKAKQKDIDFGTWELYGDRYQRPLEDLLREVSLHRWRVLQAANAGETSANSQVLDIGARIDAGIVKLEKVNKELGVALQFTPEGLGKRQRPEFTVENFKVRWEALKKAVQAGSLGAIDKDHELLITHLKTMITHAGDTSNLILDPDLDSYYLMDVTLLALPQMQDRLQQIAAFSEGLFAKQDVTKEDQLRARLLAAFLKEADMDRIAASSQTSMNEDQNFYGVSPTLKENLTKGLESLSAMINLVITQLNELAAGKNDATAREQFRLAIGAAIDEAFKFHHVAFDEEDALLKNRVNIFQAGVYDALIIGLFSVLISAVLAFLVSRNLVRRVKHVTETTKAVAAGNMRSRVRMSGGDELAELGASFDTMTDRIEGLNSEIAARNEELKAMNVNLEGIVAARTAQIATILNNVSTGFLLVSRDLRVEDGFSRACYDLFGKDFKVGLPFMKAVGLDTDRNSPMWESFLEQAFDDVLPEEMTLRQLPARFHYGENIIALDARSVRNAKGEVACILFTFHDATRLEHAEEESRHHQLLVRILREVDFFRDFVEEFKTRVGLCRRFLRGGEHGKARAELHTLKGNTSAYDLVRIAKCIHDIEDQSHIASGDIDQIEEEMRGFLASTYEVLQLSYDSASEDSFTITKADLQQIAERIKAAGYDSAALGHLKELIDNVQYRPAKVLVGALPEYGKRLAQRLMKNVEIKLEGGDLKMDPEIMKPVMQSLVHLVRNAIDHGIEDESLRGLKPETAVVTIDCSERGDHWVVEVSDDGRGIDTDQVVKKALKSGAIKPEQVLKMTQAEKQKLIFLNGLTTSDTVSEISGRGVGMNAVSAAVEEAGGQLEIFSQQGLGTTFRLLIPKVPGQMAAPRLAANS